MLQLPNGCRCSQPSVFPKNWETVAASTKKDWRIQYYFYDSEGKRKLVIVKGMNSFKKLPERRAATKVILNDETANLKAGYNPISGETIPEIVVCYEIDPDTPFVFALQKAYKKLSLSDSSMAAIKSALKYIEKAAKKLGYHNLKVCQIRRRHIIAVLEVCRLTPQSYNHYRAYMMMLFKKLVQLEAVEANPVNQDLPKMEVEEELKELFTKEERIRIDKHFKQDPYYRRFLHIFFASGARPVELTRLTTNAVNLDELYYKIKVRKRKKIVEEKRPIKRVVAHLWREILREANNGDFIFGKGLKPCNRPGTRDYITKKWQREVKTKLGINKDLYTLKHTNLDETSALLGAEAAAKQAGHTSSATTKKHYLLGEKERERKTLSEVRNTFA